MVEPVTYTRCIYSFGPCLKLIALSNNHIKRSAVMWFPNVIRPQDDGCCIINDVNDMFHTSIADLWNFCGNFLCMLCERFIDEHLQLM